jgi:type IV pilus assembly protein PilC
MDIIGIVFSLAGVIIAAFVALYLWTKYHISKTEIAVFCREMSIMLDAGMPLLRVLKILSERVSHPKLRKVVAEILESVENGNTVAAAMANHPAVFDEMMIGIIKVGETGGVMDESLRRLSVHLEKGIRLRRKVIAASVYPCLAVVVLVAVLLVLIVFVFPRILEPLKSNPRVHLPALTLAVDAMGQFVLGHWALLLAEFVAFVVLVVLFRRTLPGKIAEDYLKLKFPLVGNFLGVRVVAARVSSTFATLVHCGIPIISCLRIVAQTQTNHFVSASFRHTAKVVEEGGSLVKPLEDSGIYPRLMIDLLAVGDESGTLDTVLDKIAQAFTEEVDSAIEIFTQVQEALMILTLGGLVLLVALAAYLPYFQLWQIVD